MLSIIYFVLVLVVKIFFSLILLFVAFVLFCKFWFEPIKGVCRCTSRLDGKVALVTGGNSGIGLETARALAGRGARVVIASRDERKSRAAAADIAASTGNCQLDCLRLDLADFGSVRRFADLFNASYDRLDILVNNAGCGGLKPRLTVNGIEIVTQINYFGAFLLTNLLLDKLIASKPSRIVIVSSIGHRFCTLDIDDIAGVKVYKKKTILNDWLKYAKSKLLQVLWTKALAKRLPLGVTVNAVHPGVVQTGIFDKFPTFYKNLIKIIVNFLFKTSAEGAQPVIHLCVAPELESASGGYYADCRPSKAAAIVNDDRVVERVWNDSLTLTKSM